MGATAGPLRVRAAGFPGPAPFVAAGRPGGRGPGPGGVGVHPARAGRGAAGGLGAVHLLCRRDPGFGGGCVPDRDRAGRRAGGAGGHLHPGLPHRPDRRRRRGPVPGRVRRLEGGLPGHGRADGAAAAGHRAQWRTGGARTDRATADRFPRRVLAAVRQFLPQQRRDLRHRPAAVRGPVQVSRPGDRGDGRAVLSRLGLHQGRHRHGVQAVRDLGRDRRRVPGGRVRGRVRLPAHAAGGRAGGGVVEPGVPADGALSGADMGVLRGHHRRQHLPGLRRHHPDRVHVLADRPQLHRHPVRADGVAGQPAGQVRRRPVRLPGRGHLLPHLLPAQCADGGADPVAAGLAVAPDPRTRTAAGPGQRSRHAGPGRPGVPAQLAGPLAPRPIRGSLAPSHGGLP